MPDSDNKEDSSDDRPPTSVEDVALHAQAQQKIREFAHNYSEDLILQTKRYAYKRKDRMAEASDVERANKSVFEATVGSKWSKFVQVVGGAMFGAGISGFVAGDVLNSQVGIIGSFIATVVGLVIVFWGNLNS